MSADKIIKMDESKLIYESEGFGHVRTCIQSGNVILFY